MNFQHYFRYCAFLFLSFALFSCGSEEKEKKEIIRPVRYQEVTTAKEKQTRKKSKKSSLRFAGPGDRILGSRQNLTGGPNEAPREDTPMTFKPAMRCIAILALLMTITATSAHADFMTYNGLTLSRSVTIHDTTLGTINTRAGQFSVTYQGV